MADMKGSRGLDEAYIRGLGGDEMQAYVRAIHGAYGVVEFDLEGRILYANPLLLDALGYELSELRGQSYDILCAPEQLGSPGHDALWQHLAQGHTQGTVFMHPTRLGGVSWWRTTFTPVPGSDGKPAKVLEIARNITTDKLKMLEDESKLAAISRSQGVIEFDLAGNVLTANENFLHLMDYRIEDIKGQHHRMFMDPEEAEEAAYRVFWQRLGRGEFDGGEYLRVGRNGRRVWIQATYNPILDLEGRPVKVVKFATDITASKLKAQEEQVRMAAVAASNCILEMDKDGFVLVVNDGMERALGMNRQALLGKHEHVLMFDEDKEGATHANAWRELRAGRAVSGEFRIKGGQAREVWLRASLSPMMGLDGLLAKVLLLGQDVTESKLARLDAQGKLDAIHRAQAVVEFDLRGYVLDANSNFQCAMGYRLEEIQGAHHRMFVPQEEALGREYQAFWERLGRGEFFAGEYRRIGKGGKEVWIRATYNPVFDVRGNPIKVVKFASDVTASKLASAEYAAKVAAIDKGQAVIEFDLDGKVLSANRNFLAAMGYTLREIQGQHHSIFCTPEYVQSEEYREFWLSLSEGRFMSGRFHRVGKFNRDVWIQATYNPILDLNGRVMKIVKYAYDVTKEVALEKRIASQSGQMSAQVGMLVESIQDVARSSEQASEMAQEASMAAEAGRQALEKSMGAIGRIQHSSSRVAEIVRVISDIASQTNLLAFNAAIEAARAGAQGVGFSVVAAEVRKLAERSSTAAQEISRLIEESAEHVRAGAEVSQSAASSFEDILASVERTVSRASEIASTTEEQRALAARVGSLIHELTRAVDQK